MEPFSDKRKQIIEMLDSKSLLKQKIYNNTLEVMQLIKDTMHEMSGEINDEVTSSRLIRVEYRDRGKFEVQIQVAGDILIFAMPTNVFTFDKGDIISENGYYGENVKNQYCGVINIYNFLADSFKYNRNSDEGYLIGRLFINHENSFFIEGVGSQYDHSSYGQNKISEDIIIDIIESVIIYAMEFDLYVPPFDQTRNVVVEQMNTKAESSNIKIAKRLGREGF